MTELNWQGVALFGTAILFTTIVFALVLWDSRRN